MTRDEQIPWGAYARSVIEIEWERDIVVRIEHRPIGATEGTYPAEVSVVHVITAHNPASNILSPAENARRNDELERAIRAVGWSWRPAVSASADPTEPWEEASFAVIDGDRDDVLEVARRFDQAAIFEWTPHHRAVVPTATDDAVDTHGWWVRTERRAEARHYHRASRPEDRS